MKQLPRFVYISNPDEGLSDVILETTPPFFLGKVYGIPKKDKARVEQMMSDIANDRTTAVKLPGFTIFLTPYGSLQGWRMEREKAVATLRDMANFYRSGIIERKKHKHRQYQEDVPDDIDEQNGRKIAEARDEGRKIFLQQK